MSWMVTIIIRVIQNVHVFTELRKAKLLHIILHKQMID